MHQHHHHPQYHWQHLRRLPWGTSRCFGRPIGRPGPSFARQRPFSPFDDVSDRPDGGDGNACVCVCVLVVCVRVSVVCVCVRARVSYVCVRACVSFMCVYVCVLVVPVCVHAQRGR